jgi:NADPH:quinone reductase
MAGSPSKLSVAKTHGGADHVLDYSKPGWQKEVMKITGGKGVDVVYDPVGMIRGMYNLYIILLLLDNLVANED